MPHPISEPFFRGSVLCCVSEVCAGWELQSSLSHGAREGLIITIVHSEKFLTAWLVWLQSWNAAGTVDQESRSVLSVHLRYESDFIKLRVSSTFYRNKRYLSPKREKVPRCFCALAVAGEWLLLFCIQTQWELLNTWKTNLRNITLLSLFTGMLVPQ